MKRYFIFEGADGIGKTTLAKNFAKEIGAKFTYEPFGHTEETKKLRERALTHDVPRIAREYLLLANRDLGYQDLEKWLKEGDVVTDRSVLSGMVYANAEGFSFDTWQCMAKPLLNRLFEEIAVNPVLIICSNDNYKNKDNPDDRYDGKGDTFHKMIHHQFLFGAVELGLSHLDFKIDFNLSQEENLERLLSKFSFQVARGGSETPITPEIKRKTHEKKSRPAMD